MLEEMASFFENRLSDYDEHMMTAIEGATEFYKFTAAQLPSAERCAILDLGCGTGLELEEYFANLRQLKSEQGKTESRLYHYDTPLTIDHEVNVLRAAGFLQCEILKNWGATYTVKAAK